MKISRTKIKIILADKGWQFKDVPLKAHISSATFSKAINNKRSPSCRTIGKIAEALGVSAKEIIED